MACRIIATLVCVFWVIGAAHAQSPKYDYRLEMKSTDFIPPSPVVMLCREGVLCWAQFELKVDEQTRTMVAGGLVQRGYILMRFGTEDMPIFIGTTPYVRIAIGRPSHLIHEKLVVNEAAPSALDDWRNGRLVIRRPVRTLATINVDIHAQDEASAPQR